VEHDVHTCDTVEVGFLLPPSVRKKVSGRCLRVKGRKTGQSLEARVSDFSIYDSPIQAVWLCDGAE